MLSVFSILLTGLLAGALHVLMGPDHLAALAPLALNQKNSSWRLGVRWGFGHATGVILVAFLALYFREFISIDSFSSRCESLVGFMLIGIGIWGFRKSFRSPHAHVHSRTALAVGILHGLAGGSHFMGVLPAIAMPTREAASIYLLSFGVGTIAAMAMFSLSFGFAGDKIKNFGTQYFQISMRVCSVATIAVGGYWVLSVG